MGKHLRSYSDTSRTQGTTGRLRASWLTDSLTGILRTGSQSWEVTKILLPCDSRIFSQTARCHTHTGSPVTRRWDSLYCWSQSPEHHHTSASGGTRSTSPWNQLPEKELQPVLALDREALLCTSPSRVHVECMHTHLYTVTLTHINTYSHIPIHAHSHSYRHLHMLPYTYIHTLTLKHTFTHTHTPHYTHNLTHIHTLMHTYTHTLEWNHAAWEGPVCCILGYLSHHPEDTHIYTFTHTSTLSYPLICTLPCRAPWESSWQGSLSDAVPRLQAMLWYRGDSRRLGRHQGAKWCPAKADVLKEKAATDLWILLSMKARLPGISSQRDTFLNTLWVFSFFLIIRETLRIKPELLVAPRSGTFPVVEKMLLGEDISLIVLAFSALFSHRLFLLTFAEFRSSIST